MRFSRRYVAVALVDKKLTGRNGSSVGAPAGMLIKIVVAKENTAAALGIRAATHQVEIVGFEEAQRLRRNDVVGERSASTQQKSSAPIGVRRAERPAERRSGHDRCSVDVQRSAA